MSITKIQNKVKSYLRSSSDMAFTNTFFRGYEADVALIKRSGYLYECEVKVSRSDFLNDFRKGGYDENGKWNKQAAKHELIKNGKGANRFFFAVPEDMVSVDEVPDYAGLLYFKYNEDSEICYCRLIKKAPLIHREKFSDWKALAMKLWYRQFNLKQRIWQLEDQYAREKNKQKLK